MEKKPYLIAGVKPSTKIKYINENKQNQTDFKEYKEYAHPSSRKNRNILSVDEGYKRVT